MITQNYRETCMSRKKKALKKYCLDVVLKRLLAEKKLSLTQLSLATGKPSSTLHDWLYGNVPANPEDLKDVADYFCMTRDDLEFGTSSDRAQKAEIARLSEELEAQKIEAEKNQLNFFWLEEEFEKKKKELEEIKNNKAG